MLIQNSESGQVNFVTIFEYKQQENLVTADYYGGTIKYGKIITNLKDDELYALPMLDDRQSTKSRKSVRNFSLSDTRKIRLSLNWEWLTNDNEKGNSEYIEIEKPI